MTGNYRTIVVTGSHSVGKTTLCEHLIQELRKTHTSTALIPETARTLIARGMPMNDAVSESGIIHYLIEYLVQTRTNKAQLVISDRSVFDLFAYISCSRDPSVRNEYIQLVEEVVIAEIQRVFTYVYVPIEFPLVNDGIRPDQADYQQLIDTKIRHLLAKYNAKTITVSGSTQQRVNKIVSLIPE